MKWPSMANFASLARSAALRFNGLSMRRTKPITVPAARREESCSRIVRCRDCSRRIGREVWRSWKRGIGHERSRFGWIVITYGEPLAAFVGGWRRTRNVRSASTIFEHTGHHPKEVRCYQALGQPRVMVRYCGECGKQL